MSEGRTVRAVLHGAERRLDRAGVGESVADARLLLAEALARSATWVLAHPEEEVPEAAGATFDALLARRCVREPLQHLLGHQDFWTLRLTVGPEVLIPRPETELLVEVAVAELCALPAPRIADVGTGSGCIALSVASELLAARVVASDISPEALARARRNAEATGFAARVTFTLGDLGAPLREFAPFDAVLANLPYVTQAEWLDLEPEVRDHDPQLALVGGEQGTELIERLIAEAPGVLAPGGLLALEVGAGQAEGVAAALERHAFSGIQTRRDLAGIERVVLGRSPR